MSALTARRGYSSTLSMFRGAGGCLEINTKHCLCTTLTSLLQGLALPSADELPSCLEKQCKAEGSGCKLGILPLSPCKACTRTSCAHSWSDTPVIGVTGIAFISKIGFWFSHACFRAAGTQGCIPGCRRNRHASKIPLCLQGLIMPWT